MAKEICEDCGNVFEPKSNRGFICPDCHRKRLSQYAKERKLNKIGNIAYQEMCALRKRMATYKDCLHIKVEE